MARQKLWTQCCIFLALTLSEFQATSSDLLRCPVDDDPSIDRSQILENRELCRSADLQRSLLTGSYPYRVWEGRGHIRFLGRRHAELSCDFQHPKNIISNVIWHKVIRPRSTSYNEYSRRVVHDGYFNDGLLLQPFNYPRIYAVNRPAGSSLFIQDVSPWDFGTYRCFASRFAIPFAYRYPQVITVYQDVEFYPKHLQYEVLEK